MAALQLNFSIRTSASVKTVHLLGSWDKYTGQLPLSKDKSAKPGTFKGTFRFQSSLIRPGQRYWYYYILDGYHVSHDPAVEYAVEPTTGRKLNILDAPTNSPKAARPASHARNTSQEFVKGRALSPSKIQHPKPSRPYASRQIRETDYSTQPSMDRLASRFGDVDLSDDDSEYSGSPTSSNGSSVSSRSSPSSMSSFSDGSRGSYCSCERYGITRKGERVKIDCGGSRCGGNSPLDSESSDSCSSTSDSEEEYRAPRTTTRYQSYPVRR